jgi:hypothetical protein
MDAGAMTTRAPDPQFHMLSTQQHFWDEAGQAATRAVTLGEQADSSRRSLAESAAADSTRPIEITGTEALVAASLLREFAARMRQDVARGSVAADGRQLAEVAEDITERLYAAAGLRG